MSAELPGWVEALTPDRRHLTGDDSWLFQWLGDNHHALDFFDDGTVVAIGADGDKDAFCEVTIADRPWIEKFAAMGWRMFDKPTPPQ